MAIAFIAFLNIVRLLAKSIQMGSWMYRQSPVKNQPINQKVDNFHVLTKVPHNMRET